MQRVQHGDITVDWTDEEYQRMYEIKKQRFENRSWKPVSQKLFKQKRDNKSLHVTLPSTLKKHAQAYAKSKGVALSRLIADILIVLTSKEVEEDFREYPLDGYLWCNSCEQFLEETKFHSRSRCITNVCGRCEREGASRV